MTKTLAIHPYDLNNLSSSKMNIAAKIQSIESTQNSLHLQLPSKVYDLYNMLGFL